MKRALRQLLRGLLRRRGLEIKRVATPSLHLDHFLATRARHDSSLSRPSIVHVFDDDPRVLRALISAFGPTRVSIHAWRSWPPSPPHSGDQLMPPRTFWVSLGVERMPADVLFDEHPWAKAADVLLIRSTLGSFTSGHSRLADIRHFCETHGFSLLDIVTTSEPVTANAPGTQVILLFTRSAVHWDPSSDADSRMRRIDEATAFLPVPLVCADRFHWLSSPGSFGFAAGLFNPGALLDEDRFLVLERGEHSSWPVQEQSELTHLASCRPVLLQLNQTFQVLSHTELNFTGSLARTAVRVEDFRLFRFREQCLTNHSVITLPDERPARDQRVRLELQRARIGISTLRPAEGELQFIGFPSLDFKTHAIEKNWAMMTVDDELFLIYSVSPYRLLRCRSWADLEFTTCLTRDVSLPFQHHTRMVRNSINPVDYDDRHWLHLVHKTYPSKQYVFWALLIDKRTQIPAFVSREPIVRAGASLPASILYASSAVVLPDRVLLFAGVNDCGSGVWTIERSLLDRSWRALA